MNEDHRYIITRSLSKAVKPKTKYMVDTGGYVNIWSKPNLIQLSKDAFAILRRCIESSKTPEVSWDKPYVEIQYEVNWDWSRTPKEKNYVVYGEYIEENPHVAKATTERLEEIYNKHKFVFVAMQGIRTRAALLKKNNVYSYLLPIEAARLLENLSEDDRDAILADIYEPTYVRLVKTDDGRDDPELDSRDTGTRREYIPFVTFKGDKEGKPFEGFIGVALRPVTLNEDERRAYYTVWPDIVFMPSEQGDIVEPSNWETEYRKAFWESVSVMLDKAKDYPLLKVPNSFVDTLAVRESTATYKTGTFETDIAVPESTTVISRSTIGLAFGITFVSTKAMAIIHAAHRVRLPKKWSTIPRWKDITKDEIDLIIHEEGERAFEDLRKVDGDPEARGPLLKRRYRAGGGYEIQLTAEAERALKRRKGLGIGYIDFDDYGSECLIRLYEVGNDGLLEIGLSWQGLAGPLVDEWREEFRRQTEALQAEATQQILFSELDEERQKRIDRMMNQISLWDDGRRIMEVILGQVGRQGRNPIQIPAEAFRVLLWPERAKTRDWPQNWKQRVDGALSALRALTFRYRTYQMEILKGYGGFIGEWNYKGLGKGSHGDGIYIIDVQPGFLGCLNVFESGRTRLRSGQDAVLYDFGRKITPEEKRSLGWGGGDQKPVDTFTTFDAGRAFYNAAAGLTSNQENLLHWLERNLTLKRDTACKRNRNAQTRPNAPDANEPRRYAPDFCPLLPPDREYIGALGHFRRNPEAGFTIYGTESRPARHTAGLMAEMGHLLPPGAAHRERRNLVTKALEDLKAVVVDYLGGVVSGYNGTDWIPLDKFPTLDEKTLCRRLRIFCFLPVDYETQRRAKWEETTGRKVTESLEEAERDAWKWSNSIDVKEIIIDSTAEVEKLPSQEPVAADGGDESASVPLHHLLQTTMKTRGLRGKSLATIFGVSPMTISYWLRGPEPDAAGIIGGRAIPEEIVPFVMRWIETGIAPTEEELSNLKTRRTGVNPETGKPLKVKPDSSNGGK